MIEPRPYASLGGGDHGWLVSKHHFSFADYRDSSRVHWGALLAWNDDEIAPAGDVQVMRAGTGIVLVDAS